MSMAAAFSFYPGIAYDTERTQVLQGYGLKVLRYTNQQLKCNFQEVCWDIERNLLPMTP